ncbi:hypothetical protein [Clostridium culturomicium]|uniref:hypothetical protein n=1 Tax=Clostridium culturomicium TaxID=1499683 RepID=UPI0038578AC0
MKRTLENCSLIKIGIQIGEGKPNQYEGKCEGYCNYDGDEPMEKCKACKLNTCYED